jgi:WD40 repeat protein
MKRITSVGVVLGIMVASCVAGDIETSLSEVKTVGFSPDSKQLAYASYKDVHIWNLEEQKEVKILKGIGGDIYGLAFTKSGKSLVALVGEHALVWKVESGKMIHKVELKDYASKLAVSEKGGIFVTGGKTAKVWDVSTGKKKAELSGAKNRVVAVAISPNADVIATGNEWLKKVALWHPRGRRSRDIEIDHAAEGIVFSSDNNTIVVAGGSKVSVIDRTGDVKMSFDLPGCRGAVAVSADGKLVAAGTWLSSGSESVVIYDLAKKKAVNAFSGLPEPVYQVTFSPDGKMLAAATKDKFVHLWSIGK